MHAWKRRGCLSVCCSDPPTPVTPRLADLLVGAPMFMLRGSDGRLEEVGRVYVYLQRGPLDLELSEPQLTGVGPYGRFGNTIAPLGDLNQDGFNGGWLVLVLPSRQL